MSPFTDKEIEYLREQRLGRIATSGSKGAPHIVPVGFRLDPVAHIIQVGGFGLIQSKKWRDLEANPKIAFAVDDLASTDPWMPRGIEVRGTAELHLEGGDQLFDGADPAWIAVVPQRIISWGIEGSPHSKAGRSARSVTTK